MIRCLDRQNIIVADIQNDISCIHRMRLSFTILLSVVLIVSVVWSVIGVCVFEQSISESFRMNHRDVFYMVHASDGSSCFGCGDMGHKWIACPHKLTESPPGRRQILPLVWWPGWPPDQWPYWSQYCLHSGHGVLGYFLDVTL